jgi:hypothetical protein
MCMTKCLYSRKEGFMSSAQNFLLLFTSSFAQTDDWKMDNTANA